MIPGAIAEGVRLLVRQPREHGDGIAHVRKGLERRAELKAGSGCCRIPFFLYDTIGDVYETQSGWRGGHRRQRRGHCIKHWQRDGRSHTAQKTPAGQCFSGDIHYWTSPFATPARSRIWKAGVFTTSSTKVQNEYCFSRAAFTI